MVRKFILVMIVSLMLCGCAYIFYSPFPAYLPLVTEVADLEDFIAPNETGCEDCYRLHLLGNYVALTLPMDMGGQLIFLDEELKVKQVNFGSYGNLGFVDAAGHFPIGEHLYDGTSLLDIGVVNFELRDGFGFTDSSLNEWVLKRVDMDPFITEVYNMTGSVVGAGDFKPDYELRGLGYDPAALRVYLFFSDFDQRGGYAASIPESSLPGFGSISLGPPEYEVVSLPRSEDGRYHYTRDGFVAVSGGDYKLCSLENGKVIKSITGIEIRRTACVFDVDGKYFYVYDAEARKIYKCKTWWQR